MLRPPIKVMAAPKALGSSSGAGGADPAKAAFEAIKSIRAKK